MCFLSRGPEWLAFCIMVILGEGTGPRGRWCRAAQPGRAGKPAQAPAWPGPRSPVPQPSRGFIWGGEGRRPESCGSLWWARSAQCFTTQPPPVLPLPLARGGGCEPIAGGGCRHSCSPGGQACGISGFLLQIRIVVGRVRTVAPGRTPGGLGLAFARRSAPGHRGGGGAARMCRSASFKAPVPVLRTLSRSSPSFRGRL